MSNDFGDGACAPAATTDRGVVPDAETGDSLPYYIRELIALESLEDGRTIAEMIAADPCEEYTVEKVEKGKDGWFTVTFDKGTCTGLKMPDGQEVKEGDSLRLYPNGWLGTERHGFAVNGEVIEWKTRWERAAERVTWLAGHDRRKRENFAESRVELDRKYEALPAPLKARIDRLREKNPNFRVDAEAYEMAAVWDAPKIAEALKAEVDAGEDPEVVVTRFRSLSWEEQNERVPGLNEGHSGNTFAGATMLAYRLLAGLEC